MITTEKHPDTEDITEEAFGIITTGIEPLEITESGAIITGYINAERRKDMRLGTYVIVPYGEEHLFARIWKIQYKQEFAVDDATELHSRRMLRSNNIDEVITNSSAYLDPICILYPRDQIMARRMSDRIPQPNTPYCPLKTRQ